MNVHIGVRSVNQKRGAIFSYRAGVWSKKCCNYYDTPWARKVLLKLVQENIIKKVKGHKLQESISAEEGIDMSAVGSVSHATCADRGAPWHTTQ